MSETQYARSLGLNLTTYRAVKAGGKQGPALSTILCMIENAGLDEVIWLLTGKEHGEAKKDCPPPGYDLVRLPRGDPDRLSANQADLLEKALVVLRAEGPSVKHFSQSLENTIDSFHKGVMQANELEGPQKGKATRKAS